MQIPCRRKGYVATMPFAPLDKMIFTLLLGLLPLVVLRLISFSATLFDVAIAL
jgi:hypothetical protein